eukprot:Rhum_TRINITY_DN9120_c0_g1::Rhum_TRINITY_DN9120_c0_g1_i1::g.31726::m.31726
MESCSSSSFVVLPIASIRTLRPLTMSLETASASASPTAPTGAAAAAAAASPTAATAAAAAASPRRHKDLGDLPLVHPALTPYHPQRVPSKTAAHTRPEPRGTVARNTADAASEARVLSIGRGGGRKVPSGAAAQAADPSEQKLRRFVETTVGLAAADKVMRRLDGLGVSEVQELGLLSPADVKVWYIPVHAQRQLADAILCVQGKRSVEVVLDARSKVVLLSAGSAPASQSQSPSHSAGTTSQSVSAGLTGSSSAGTHSWSGEFPITLRGDCALYAASGVEDSVP